MPHVSYLVPSRYFDFSNSTAPSEYTRSSGMTSKVWNVHRAIPEIRVRDRIEESAIVHLVEPLWFVNKTDERLQSIKDSQELTLLWAEEQELSRWNGNEMENVFNSVNGIAVCNEYYKQVITEFVGYRKIHVLRTPIDSHWFQPATGPKEPFIVGIGQISHEKNILDLCDLFKRVRNLDYGDKPKLQSVYIGNSEMWAENTYHNREAGQEVGRSADIWIPSANRREVAEWLSKSWGYVNMSIYDVGCLSFLEAGMAGCHAFCWNEHPMFDEYPVTRFDDAEAGAKAIHEEYMADDHAHLKDDVKLMHHIRHHHSYNSFRAQLSNVIRDNLV